MHAVKGPIEIGANEPIPRFGRQFAEGAFLQIRAGVVDENVDRPKFFSHRSDESDHLLFVGNIGRYGKDHAPLARYSGRGVGGEGLGDIIELLLIAARDGNLGPFFKQSFGGRGADARPAAGDERDFAGEFSHEKSL